MSKVLVTGATGNIGSQLVPRLANHDGVEVRAFVRDPEKAASLQEAGAELAVGTFEDAESVKAAVEGIDQLVLITPPNPRAKEQAHTVLTAAKEAGVKRVIRISVLKADVDGPTDNVRQHGHTDQEIQDSGLNYTILRPHFFMQNIFMGAQSIAEEGNLYMGMGDGKLGMIDVRDIVDVTERVVVEDGHENAIYNLTGPETITFYRVTDAVGEALDKEVNYVPVPPAAVEQSLKEMGMGDWFSEVMRDYSQAYSEGWGDLTTENVEKVAGHKARSVDQFAQEVFAPALQQGN